MKVLRLSELRKLRKDKLVGMVRQLELDKLSLLSEIGAMKFEMMQHEIENELRVDGVKSFRRLIAAYVDEHTFDVFHAFKEVECCRTNSEAMYKIVRKI